MAKPHAKPHRTNNRDPVAHHVHLPLTANEHIELQTLATLESTTYSELLRRALREYAARVRR